MNPAVYVNIASLYPDEPPFAAPVKVATDGLATCPAAIRDEMLDHVGSLLLQWVPPQRLFDHERDQSASSCN